MLEATQNGGLTAPPPARGLNAQRRPPAIRPRRRATARGRRISQVLDRARQAGRIAKPGERAQPLPLPIGPGQGAIPGQAGASRRATRGAGAAKAPAVGSAVQANLGRQLSRRVASGAVTQPQADQVASDRALLESVYGPNWRVKVFGDKGYVQRTRAQLAQEPNDPQVRALYEQLMRQRSSALERAKKKRTAQSGSY